MNFDYDGKHIKIKPENRKNLVLKVVEGSIEVDKKTKETYNETLKK